MNRQRVVPLVGLFFFFILLVPQAFAHGGSGTPGSGPGPDVGMIVTRHFTGIWDQVEQEGQGFALQVVEQLDESRRAVAYWYTYGDDRQSAWYVGIGDLVDNRIEMELYESSDVGFMQPAASGNDSVTAIGTMTITFESCQAGEVDFVTTEPEVGSGSFRIERLLEVMNTHCTGGISDDMHADAMLGEQRIALSPARTSIDGAGHARYADIPSHMEFEVTVENLPDGEYHLFVGMQDRGSFTVQEGHGRIGFVSPAEDGYHLMSFDPRGMTLEIHDAQGAVLSSFDQQMAEDDHGEHGGDYGHGGDGAHDYDCAGGSGTGHGMGGGMGGGMTDCVDDGDYVEVAVDLSNTGLLPDAKGEAEWEMNTHRVAFSVQIEGVPAGAYPLLVGDVEVGIIQAIQMHDGEVFGRISFRDPAISGRPHLDFELRGQLVEVMQDGAVILEAEFPDQ